MWRVGILAMTHKARSEAGREVRVDLSLRDYFAAACLPRVIRDVGTSGWQEHAAWNAYSLADAMLREREKDPTP